MLPLKIEVAGHSKISVRAELAILTIDASYCGHDQQTASKHVLFASKQLDEMLSSLSSPRSPGKQQNRSDVPGVLTIAEKNGSDAAAVIQWSTSTLSLQLQTLFGQASNAEPRYIANMTYQATFRDLSQLGAFTSFLFSTDNVRIRNVQWKLTQATISSLGTRSRHEAVQDARKKTEDYAAAIGVTDLHVTHIRDVPERSTSRGLFGNSGGGGGGGLFGESSDSSIMFQPPDVSIECDILVVLEKQ